MLQNQTPLGRSGPEWLSVGFGFAQRREPGHRRKLCVIADFPFCVAI